MSGIDQELEEAVRANEASAGAGESASDGTPRSGVTRDATEPEAEPKRWGLLVGLFGLMGVILALVFTSEGEAVVYAYGVDEVKARAAELGDRRVRVVGDLVTGTLVRRDEPCEYRFELGKGADRIKVHYAQCVVPDTFRDVEGVKVEVTAEGRLMEDGHLFASQIMAKCPSKYEMKEQAAESGKRPNHGGGEAKPKFIEPKQAPAIN